MGYGMSQRTSFYQYRQRCGDLLLTELAKIREVLEVAHTVFAAQESVSSPDELLLTRLFLELEIEVSKSK